MAKKSQDSEPILEPQPIQDAEPAPAVENPRERQGIAPFCPYHPKTRCKSGRSDPYFTRYYCPEEGCTFSQKIARPRKQIERALDEADDAEGFAAR